MRKRVQKIFEKPSLTRQEFRKECDLALTIKRFAKTPEGRLALRNAQGYAGNAQFLDVTAIPDYRTALDTVNRSNASFLALPAIVRRRFDNDAAYFLDFCSDPKNLPELRQMGLAKPEVKAETPVKTA